MWIDIIKFFGALGAICLTLWGIAKQFANLKRGVLPECDKRMAAIEKNIEKLKQSDTDKMRSLAAIQAKLASLEDKIVDMKTDLKESIKNRTQKLETFDIQELIGEIRKLK